MKKRKTRKEAMSPRNIATKEYGTLVRLAGRLAWPEYEAHIRD